jgi:hypothetical protein
MPIGVVAGKARNLDAEHDANVPKLIGQFH